MKSIFKLFVLFFVFALLSFQTLSASAAATLTPLVLGTYKTSGSADEIFIAGNNAYVVGYHSGLQIIDVSNSSSPSLVGSYTPPGIASDVVVSGNYAYIVDRKDDHADIGSGWMHIIDISMPSSPVLVGTYNITGKPAGIAISGNYAYVAVSTSPGGLLIIDISNVASPTLVSTATNTDMIDVAISGNYAYIIDSVANMDIIDITSPSSPLFVSSTDLGAPLRISISGKYAYVGTQDGLKIIDISNPINPALKYSEKYPDSVYSVGIFILGENAYVAGTSVRVFNTSNPSAATLIGEQKSGSFDVVVSGGYVYVAAGVGGLHIIQFKHYEDNVKDLNKDIKVDQKVVRSVKGRIIIQTEGKGEAWYVNPKDSRKYSLGKPVDALTVIRKLGMGISNANLAKIPKNGTNAKGDQALMNRLKGKILIQVQGKGEAWYVHPVTGKRYSLGRPSDAFSVMKSVGVGITNANLNKISTGLVVQ